MVQRVSQARVLVEGRTCGEIGTGLLVFLAALKGDGKAELDFLSRKVAGLRIFTDTEGRMNKDVACAGGEVLVVSQFTLAAPTASGNRPSFSAAMPPEEAAAMVEAFKASLADNYGLKVASGEFGAHMQVELMNDGPVTIILDTARRG